MKHVKKIALALVGVMLAGILSGCGAKFDAAAYLQATLDNSYKNESSGLVKMKLCTAEEAAAIYEDGMNIETKSFLQGLGLSVSEAQEEEFLATIKDIFSKTKYTVGDVEKKDDGSYVVKVTCEKMIIFAPMQAECAAAVLNLQGDASFAALSQDQQTEKLVELIKDSMKAAAGAATYEEPAEFTVRIELQNKLYAPNKNDLISLEMALIDFETQ